MKHLLTTLFMCAFLMISTGCGFRDLREGTLLEEHHTLSPESQARGAFILDSMRGAHGSIASHSTARIVMSDTWFSWIKRRLFTPWKSNTQRLELLVELGTSNSRMTLLSGPDQAQITGIQNWATYHVNYDKETVFEAREETWFWLPTMHYFVEAAFRISEAEYVGYAGQMIHEGRTLQGVFLTWGSPQPSHSADQYIAWVDVETSRLSILEYTVRDIHKSVKSTAVYSNYSRHDDVIFPGKITIYNGDIKDNDTLHTFDVHTIQLDPVSPKALTPEPSIHYKKTDRGGST